MDNKDTLAMEMLKELKKASKRNFILAIVLLLALVISNLAWLIYESQFETEYSYDTVTEQSVEDAENSNINQVMEE